MYRTSSRWCKFKWLLVSGCTLRLLIGIHFHLYYFFLKSQGWMQPDTNTILVLCWCHVGVPFAQRGEHRPIYANILAMVTWPIRTGIRVASSCLCKASPKRHICLVAQGHCNGRKEWSTPMSNLSCQKGLGLLLQPYEWLECLVWRAPSTEVVICSGVAASRLGMPRGRSRYMFSSAPFWATTDLAWHICPQPLYVNSLMCGFSK